MATAPAALPVPGVAGGGGARLDYKRAQVEDSCYRGHYSRRSPRGVLLHQKLPVTPIPRARERWWVPARAV